MKVPLNNFNLLRLLFALFVLISHSYPLAGATTRDYLNQITHGQTQFSYIGLYGFFSISGYLVFQSLERSRSLTDYFRNRALRIFPALFVVLLLTVLLGFLVYEFDLRSYLTNGTVWTYLPKNLTLVRGQGSIEGIFTHNPYGPTINGSLWSLLYEFSFYIVLAIIFFFNRRFQLALMAVVVISLLVAGFGWYHVLHGYSFILELYLVLDFAPFFFFGSLLALLKIENVPARKVVLTGLFLLFLISIFVTTMNLLDYSKFFILPPLIILFGLETIPFINRAIEKLGDISYGVYIYAFPVQQTLMHFFAFSVMELMVYSLIITCVLGYCSWHLIERRALRLKR